MIAKAADASAIRIRTNLGHLKIILSFITSWVDVGTLRGYS